VTVNILLAVGLSLDELSSGRQDLLLGWLDSKDNVEGMLTAAGIDTSAGSGLTADWLQRPEMIFAALKSAKRANVKLAVGLAVPLGACLVVLVVVLAVVLVRYRRRGEVVASVAAAHKAAGKQVGFGLGRREGRGRICMI